MQGSVVVLTLLAVHKGVWCDDYTSMLVFWRGACSCCFASPLILHVAISGAELFYRWSGLRCVWVVWWMYASTWWSRLVLWCVKEWVGWVWLWNGIERHATCPLPPLIMVRWVCSVWSRWVFYGRIGVNMFSRVFVSARLEARCVGGDVDVAGGLSIGHVSTRRLDKWVKGGKGGRV